MDKPSAISASTRETAKALFDKALQRQEIRRQWNCEQPRVITVSTRALCGLLLLTVIATALSTTLVLSRFGGQFAARSSSLPTMAVYIHRKTGKIVRVSPDESKNDPAQGQEPGMVPALWCPKCEKWFPGPSKDERARFPLGIVLCPQDRRTVLKPGP